MKKSEYYLRELKKDLSSGLSKLKDPSRNAPARLGAVRFYMEGAEANLQAYEEALEEEPEGDDQFFIEHIQSHLEPGQGVICKICGRSAGEIIAEARREKSQSTSDEAPVECLSAEAL